MRSRLVLLGGQTTALGLMMALLVVPASALFLHTYGAGSLPYAYIAVAVAGLAVSTGVSRAGRRLALGHLARALVSAYLVVVLLSWIALTVWEATWVTFLLLVLFPLAIPTGFVAVGSQAVRLYDLRRFKAEFPRIVAGFAIGFALGGLAAAWLAKALGGIEHLLAVDVGAALVMLWLVVQTSRAYPGELLTPPEPAVPPSSEAGLTASHDGSGAGPSWWTKWSKPLRDPLVLLVFGYQVLQAGVTQLLDFVVWERAAAYYPDTRDLAQFQGIFGAIINVVALAFVMIAAGWLLSRFGIRLGLAANPAIILLVVAGTVVLGHSSGIAGFTFLAAACLGQVLHISLTDGLTRTAIATTYQAMPKRDRLWSQAMIEGAGTPVGVGLVGVLLLAKEAAGLDVLAVVWLLLGLTAAWLVLGILAHGHYGDHLAAVLVARAWDPVALRVTDTDAFAGVRRLLDSDDLGDRMTGLDVLVDSGSPELAEQVARDLRHTDPERQLVALAIVARTAIAAEPVVQEALHDLVARGRSAPGVVAAAALVAADEQGSRKARELWVDAMESGDDELVSAALIGATRTPDAFFRGTLLEHAGHPHPPLELLQALSAHADHLTAVLPRLWTLDPFASEDAVRRKDLVLRAVSRSTHLAGREWLLARLNEADTSRHDAVRIISGLAAAGHEDSPAPVPAAKVAVPLRREAARVTSLLTGLALLGDDVTEDGPPADGRDRTLTGTHRIWPDLDLDVLRGALRDELGAGQRRVEKLMGLSACPQGTSWVMTALAGTDESLRSAAIELIEVALGRRLGRLALTVIDPALDDAGRRAALAGQLPEGAGSADLVPWLVALLEDTERTWADPWLWASALRVLPRLDPEAASEAARGLASDPDVVLAETAAWVLGRDPSKLR